MLQELHLSINWVGQLRHVAHPLYVLIASIQIAIELGPNSIKDWYMLTIRDVCWLQPVFDTIKLAPWPLLVLSDRPFLYPYKYLLSSGQTQLSSGMGEQCKGQVDSCSVLIQSDWPLDHSLRNPITLILTIWQGCLGTMGRGVLGTMGD